MALFKILKPKFLFLFITFLFCQQAVFSQYPVANSRSAQKFITKQNGKFYISETSGLPIPYEQGGEFINGLCVVEKNKKAGCIDTTGKLIIDTIYAYISNSEMRKELLVRSINGKYGIVDFKNKIIIDTIYNGLKPGRYGYILRQNNLYGYADLNAKIILPIEYDRIQNVFSNGLAQITKLNKSGYFNTKGQIKIPLKYQLAESFDENYAVVKFGGNYRVIDTLGKELKTDQFDLIVGFEGGLAAVMKNNKWGFINTSGKTVVPLIYDKTQSYSSGYYIAQLRDEEYYFYKNGKLKEKHLRVDLQTVETIRN